MAGSFAGHRALAISSPSLERHAFRRPGVSFITPYSEAIDADRAHALLPDDLGIEINRAHALMFVERSEEARALYLAHKGKPISEQDSSLWERVIGDDFAKLRKAGLTHPMMADIENELGVSR